MILKRVARRVKRYPVRLEVKEINGRPSPWALLVDISSLGARLEASQPMAPRNSVSFSVQLPGNDKETRLAGQIVWMLPVMSAPGRFWMGLQFFRPLWEVERLVREGKIKEVLDR